MAALCTRLRVQDKLAKRTFPGPKQGPWLGTVSHTDQGKVVELISLEKWIKTRLLIVELYTMHRKALLREVEWWATHQCICATRDTKGQQRYRWAPGGFEVYQSWHADHGSC